MPLISPLNTEAELSYAYIHAVAAAARMSCEVVGRHLDNSGVDAMVSARDQFAPDSIYTDLSLHVQLKATIRPARLNSRGRYPYFMDDLDQYNRLRLVRAMPLRILVVLFLPAGEGEWLDCNEERVVLKRCAYWTSLTDAPASSNDSGQTVYLPQNQPFSPVGLRALFTRLSKGERLSYEP